MFICFTDEAGKPEPSQQVFVMADVIIRANCWDQFESEFETLKKKYELASADEIHAAWIDSDDLAKQQEQIPNFVSMPPSDRRTAIEQLWKRDLKAAAQKCEDQKSLKAKQKSLRPYVHLTDSDRRRLLQDACDLLANSEEVSLLIKAVDTALYGDADARLLRAVLDLTFAFKRFLTEQSEIERADSRGTTSSFSPMGLLVHDVCDKPMVAKVIVQAIENPLVRKEGEPRRLCPAPLFVDSELTNMIQFADLCAYAARKYLKRADATLFDRIEPRFAYANHSSSKSDCDCRLCARYA